MFKPVLMNLLTKERHEISVINFEIGAVITTENKIIGLSNDYELIYKLDLQDANDNEIYSGDTLQVVGTDITFQVIFQNGLFVDSYFEISISEWLQSNKLVII